MVEMQEFPKRMSLTSSLYSTSPELILYFSRQTSARQCRAEINHNAPWRKPVQ
jgi:hypothetical protein